MSFRNKHFQEEKLIVNDSREVSPFLIEEADPANYHL